MYAKSTMKAFMFFVWVFAGGSAACSSEIMSHQCDRMMPLSSG